MADYAENILEAIELLTEKKIQSAGFDKTIKATILSVGDNGEYVCTTGSINFTAHSSNGSYQVNDIVMVNIPENNWDNPKTILNRIYIDNSQQNYIDPFSNFVDLHGGPVVIAPGETGVAANILERSSRSIYSTSNFDELYDDDYTAIGIGLSYKTLLADAYRVCDGTYGIKITFNDENNTNLASYDISCDTLFGNIYNFNDWMPQKFLIKLPSLMTMHRVKIMNIELYQKNDFYRYNTDTNQKERLEYPVQNPDDNIFASNLTLYLGFDKEQIALDTYVLSTNSIPQYYKKWSEEVNTKYFEVYVWRINGEGDYQKSDEFDSASFVKRYNAVGDWVNVNYDLYDPLTLPEDLDADTIEYQYGNSNIITFYRYKPIPSTIEQDEKNAIKFEYNYKDNDTLQYNKLENQLLSQDESQLPHFIKILWRPITKELQEPIWLAGAKVTYKVPAYNSVNLAEYNILNYEMNVARKTFDDAIRAYDKRVSPEASDLETLAAARDVYYAALASYAPNKYKNHSTGTEASERFLFEKNTVFIHPEPGWEYGDCNDTVRYEEINGISYICWDLILSESFIYDETNFDGKGGWFLDDQTACDTMKALNLAFRPKEYLLSTMVNNTIYCNITKDDYEFTGSFEVPIRKDFSNTFNKGYILTEDMKKPFLRYFHHSGLADEVYDQIIHFATFRREYNKRENYNYNINYLRPIADFDYTDVTIQNQVKPQSLVVASQQGPVGEHNYYIHAGGNSYDLTLIAKVEGYVFVNRGQNGADIPPDTPPMTYYTKIGDNMYEEISGDYHQVGTNVYERAEAVFYQPYSLSLAGATYNLKIDDCDYQFNLTTHSDTVNNRQLFFKVAYDEVGPNRRYSDYTGDWSENEGDNYWHFINIDATSEANKSIDGYATKPVVENYIKNNLASLITQFKGIDFKEGYYYKDENGDLQLSENTNPNIKWYSLIINGSSFTFEKLRYINFILLQIKKDNMASIINIPTLKEDYGSSDFVQQRLDYNLVGIDRIFYDANGPITSDKFGPQEVKYSKMLTGVPYPLPNEQNEYSRSNLYGPTVYFTIDYQYKGEYDWQTNQDSIVFPDADYYVIHNPNEVFYPTIMGNSLQDDASYLRYNEVGFTPNFKEVGYGSNYPTMSAVTPNDYLALPVVFQQRQMYRDDFDEWNGSKVQIGDDAVFSPVIGAGTKSGGKFTGVLMGDVGRVDSSVSPSYRAYGLYGYKGDEQVFGLRADGTMFIGKKGNGQLLLDGNKSTIQSKLYSDSHNKGMLIDFDDGIIDMKNNVNNTDYQLLLNVKNDNLSLTDKPLKIGVNGSPKFYVDWTGQVYAKDIIIDTGTLSGAITTANNATITNITVQNSTVKNTSIINNNGYGLKFDSVTGDLELDAGLELAAGGSINAGSNGKLKVYGSGDFEFTGGKVFFDNLGIHYGSYDVQWRTLTIDGVDYLVLGA